MPKVKVYALKSSLYFEGVPYMAGDPIDLPEYMLREWLSLGLVSQEPPAPKEVVLEGTMHKDEPRTAKIKGGPLPPRGGSAEAAEKPA
jgi:hypothetical protein